MPDQTVDPRLVAIAARLATIRTELGRLDDAIALCDPRVRRRLDAWATALRCATDGLLDDVEDMSTL
jgi:hypothetical protein